MRYSLSFITVLCCLFYPNAFSENASTEWKKPTPAQLEQLSQASLDAYIYFFNKNIQSGRNFVDVFYRKSKTTNKKEAEELFDNLGSAPTLSREKNHLIFTFSQGKISVEWPDLTKNQVFIEGISWTVDPSAPLKLQINSLLKKLHHATQQSASLLDSLILPEAHAGKLAILKIICNKVHLCGWIGAAVVGAIATGTAGDIKNGLGNGGCALVAKAGWKPWDAGGPGWCRSWKLADLEWIKKMQTTEDEKKDPDVAWIPNDIKCSQKDDAGNMIFDSKIYKSVQVSKGNWQTNTYGYHALAKVKDNKITTLYLFDNTQSASLEKNAEPKIKLNYVTTSDSTNATPTLESIDFLKKNPTGLENKYANVATTDESSQTPPDFRNDVPDIKSMSVSLVKFINACSTIKEVAKIAPAAAAAAAQTIQDPNAQPAAK